MRWLAFAALIGTASADPKPPKVPPLYAALFVQGRKWSLPAKHFSGDDKPVKGSLQCEVTQVASVGATQRAWIKCKLHEGDGDNDWGAGYPAGIYVADDKGLAHIGSMPWPDDMLDKQMKTDDAGTHLLDARPSAYKHVTHSPVGDQQTTDVVTLRAIAGGWCYTEAGNFDESEYTVCIDKTGIVGARLQKVMADGHYDIGKVPAQFLIR